MAEEETAVVPTEGENEADVTPAPTSAEKPDSALPPSTSQAGAPPPQAASVTVDGGNGSEGSSGAKAPSPSMPPTPQEKKAREFADQAEKKYKSSLTFFGGLFG